VFRTPCGNIVHSGDYKIDPAPIDGRLTDIEGLSAVGDEGVRLLMCDITNVERTGRTMSESAVGPAVLAILKNAKGRVFTTTFASNIHRIQQIVNACVECGRMVVFAGRSMIKNTVMAQEIGYLTVPSGYSIDIDSINRYPPERVCVVITGSQGEPMAALTQIAQDRHARISIHEDDTVIFSASPIPGNETAIHSVVNDLFSQGADVISGAEYGVHASGHGSQDDIEEYLSCIRPDFLMPHHGQPRHLYRFGKVVAAMGIGEDRVIRAKLGERWRLSKDGYEVVETVRAGVVFISGDTGGEVGYRTIKERQELARDGALYISIALSHDGRRRLSDVVIDHKGFIPEHRDPELYTKIREAVITGISGNRLRSKDYRLQLQNNIGQLVGTVINTRISLKPNIQVLVNYIDRDESVIERAASNGNGNFNSNSGYS
jgi:ribonuclease J